jgi:hypothetical protein
MHWYNDVVHREDVDLLSVLINDRKICSESRLYVPLIVMRTSRTRPSMASELLFAVKIVTVGGSIRYPNFLHIALVIRIIDAPESNMTVTCVLSMVAFPKHGVTR